MPLLSVQVIKTLLIKLVLLKVLQVRTNFLPLILLMMLYRVCLEER
jgi:hypothetical protein